MHHTNLSPHLSRRYAALLWVVISALASSQAFADPCGMVPPIWDGPGPAITRVGEQMTYVFFKDGIETFVIRPGFSGKVDNFGMLIPFPSPPAIRKVPDELFDHLAKAIDPPEVVIDLRPPPPPMSMKSMSGGAVPSAPSEGSGGLAYDTVKVLRQEAVGMYEVSVLEAGSAKALRRWLDANGYVYPDGMDEPVNDYVKARWAFVAVKTKVGAASQVTPRAGMRRASPQLPKGSAFDGQVQGMGFRFKVDAPVVPMRLSAFNAGHLRNIVYYLGESPSRIEGIDPSVVRRQLKGKDLHRNVTQPLPLRILGGTYRDVPPQKLSSIKDRRDPGPHNHYARALLSSDLFASRTKRLALPFEEKEKVLLRIGEALNLRGKGIDALHQGALNAEMKRLVKSSLGELDPMTLNVVDGEFPREHIAKHNLTFSRFVIPKDRNNNVTYDAVKKGRGYDRGGVVVFADEEERLSGKARPKRPKRRRWWRP